MTFHGKMALAGASAGLLVATSIHANPHDRFAYEFEMTPEEGPVDPVVEKRYSADFVSCKERAVSTLANAACLSSEFTRQDAALNRTWRTTLANFDPKLRRALLAAQRRWVAGRDPFCRSKAAEFSGGTIAPIIYVSCRVELTIRRTLWLEGQQSATVPLNMQGTWGRHGRCDLVSERLTITARRAGSGKGQFSLVKYDPQFESIYWAEEGVVDNFVMGRTRDVLVHNTQGFHMPGEEGYARCDTKLKRVTWPPR